MLFFDGAKSDGAKSVGAKSVESNSLLGLKRGKSSEKLSNTCKKYDFFSSESLAFCKDFAQIKSESLTLLFFKSKESDALTVALF